MISPPHTYRTTISAERVRFVGQPRYTLLGYISIFLISAIFTLTACEKETNQPWWTGSWNGGYWRYAEEWPMAGDYSLRISADGFLEGSGSGRFTRNDTLYITQVTILAEAINDSAFFGSATINSVRQTVPQDSFAWVNKEFTMYFVQQGHDGIPRGYGGVYHDSNRASTTEIIRMWAHRGQLPDTNQGIIRPQ